MNLPYYINEITEELNGAKEYAQKAIKYKGSHDDWAAVYMRMSEQEMGHAQNLMKIFEDDYSQSTDGSEIMMQIHDSVIDMYSEKAACVKAVQETYNGR